jgi:hypothetical protein
MGLELPLSIKPPMTDLLPLVVVGEALMIFRRLRSSVDTSAARDDRTSDEKRWVALLLLLLFLLQDNIDMTSQTSVLLTVVSFHTTK